MKIRVWNAYASNNSGSYTIVGSLPSATVASETAERLRELVAAQDAWYDDGTVKTSFDDSPYVAFCREHGLPWDETNENHRCWPEDDYGGDGGTQVVAIGNQIMIHHRYTVSMPTAFGAYIYAQGGRVQHEENHAHNPLVVTAQFWWGWTPEERAIERVENPALLAEIASSDCFLSANAPVTNPAAWGIEEPFNEVRVGAVFTDIVEGVKQLHELATRHRAYFSLSLSEMPSDHHDPLAYLRPSAPAPEGGRYDIVITDVGPNRPAAVAAIATALGYYENHLRTMLVETPATVARSISKPRADAAMEAIREVHASADMVRNDG